MRTGKSLKGEIKRDRAGELRRSGDISTSLSKGIRGIPDNRGDYYLELYFLQKERERLLYQIMRVNDEAARKKKLGMRVERRLADLDQKMAYKREKAFQNQELNEEPAQVSPSSASGNKEPEKRPPWNKLTVGY